MMSLVGAVLILSLGAQAQSVDESVACNVQGRSFQFCRFDLLGDFDIYWSVNDTSDPPSIDLAFDVAATSGQYYALGISPQRDPLGQPQNVMPGSNAVIGCGDSNNALSGDLTVNDYLLAQKSTAAVNSAGNQQLMAHSETRIDGRCTVFYTRPIAPENLDVNQHLIDEDRTVVVAFGPYDGSVASHGFSSDDRTFLEVNFASGDATAPVDIPLDIYWSSHGVLMAVAFGFFFPGGILAAHHKKVLFNGKKLGNFKLWYQVHRFMMPMGALLSTIGFILILAYESGTYTIGPHFVIGWIAMIAIWLQFTFVRFRPKGGKKGEPLPPARRRWNLAHWWNGRTAAILAFINCVIGFTLLEPPVGFLIFFLVVVGLIVTTYLGLDIFTATQKKGDAKSKSGPSKQKEVEMGGAVPTASA